jgi:hypothetical protein
VRENLVPLSRVEGRGHAAGRALARVRALVPGEERRIIQNDAGTYSKIGSPDGTIYLVSGCGGKTGSGTLDQPHMAESKGNVAGFNVIDLSVRGDARLVRRARRLRPPTSSSFARPNDTVAPYVAASSTRADDEIELVFDEPVRAGTSGSGAENVAHDNLIGGGTVVDATLDSDQRTVTLTDHGAYSRAAPA